MPDRGSRELRALRGWRVGEPQWTGASNAIQYRTLGRVARVRAFLVRSPRLPVGGKRLELAGAPPIITRADWHADEAIRRAPPYYADGIHLAIVHHTAGSNSYSKAQSASIVRAIELYHVQGNGWNDIGYNFLVDKYGQVFEGRYGGITRPVIGAHAQGFNSGSVGISVIGDYGSTSISPAARAALVSLIAWRLDLAHVDPLSKVARVSAGNPRYAAGTAVTLNAISGHRDVYPTSCPGASLYAQLPSLRTEVSKTGLPKLYSPVVVGTLGGPIRFTRAALGVRDVDGDRARRRRRHGRERNRHGEQGRLDLGRDRRPRAALRLVDHGAADARGDGLDRQRTDTALPPAAEGRAGIVTPNGDGRGDEAKATYRLSTAATVTAEVEDLLGNSVATVFVGQRSAGKQDLTWSPDAIPDGSYRLALTAVAGTKQVQSSTQLLGRPHACRDDSERCLPSRRTATAASIPTACRSRSSTRPRSRVRVLRGSQARRHACSTPRSAPGRSSWPGTAARFPTVATRSRSQPLDSLLTVTQTVLVVVDRKAPALRLVSLRTADAARLRARDAGRCRERSLAEARREEGRPGASAAPGNGSRADRVRDRPGRQQEPRPQRAALSHAS